MKSNELKEYIEKNSEDAQDIHISNVSNNQDIDISNNDHNYDEYNNNDIMFENNEAYLLDNDNNDNTNIRKEDNFINDYDADANQNEEFDFSNSMNMNLNMNNLKNIKLENDNVHYSNNNIKQPKGIQNKIPESSKNNKAIQKNEINNSRPPDVLLNLEEKSINISEEHMQNINNNEELNNDIQIEMNNMADSNQNKSQFNNLMKLQFISICQSCKETFNSHSNIPFMFKCGHFFCRNCILCFFSDEEGKVYCPEDSDVVANNLSELKLLQNLICEDEKVYNQSEYNNNNTNNNEEQNVNVNKESVFCSIHTDQRFTHIVEIDSVKQAICVHCAFQLIRTNPKADIKEISEVCNGLLTNINGILENNQSYLEVLQDSLKDIKDNKAREEEIVNNFYNTLISLLENKKNEYLDKISNVFSSNADKLAEKLDKFSQRMEEAEDFKMVILQLVNNPLAGSQVPEIMTHFENYIQNLDEENNYMDLVEFNFQSESENKISKYLVSTGDIKITNKIVKFIPKNMVINFRQKENVNLNLNNFTNNTINAGNSSNTLQQSRSNNDNHNHHSKNETGNNFPNSNQTAIQNTNSNSKDLRYYQKPTNSSKNDSKKVEMSETDKLNSKSYLINNDRENVSNKVSINYQFEPSNSIKKNIEKANNIELPNSTSNKEYYAQVNKNKLDLKPYSNYAQEVLNTDDLLREYKETTSKKYLFEKSTNNDKPNNNFNISTKEKLSNVTKKKDLNNYNFSNVNNYGISNKETSENDFKIYDSNKNFYSNYNENYTNSNSTNINQSNQYVPNSVYRTNNNSNYTGSSLVNFDKIGISNKKNDINTGKISKVNRILNSSNYSGINNYRDRNIDRDMEQDYDIYWNKNQNQHYQS